MQTHEEDTMESQPNESSIRTLNDGTVHSNSSINDEMMGAHHFLIGPQGGQKITQLLSRSNNPKAAITQFQTDYSLKTAQHVQPIFELTDLLDFRRNQLYGGMMTFVRDFFLRHLEKNNDFSQEEELKLLEQVFPYIAFEELRPIANTILNRMEVIPERFLKQLKPDIIFKVRRYFSVSNPFFL